MKHTLQIARVVSLMGTPLLLALALCVSIGLQQRRITRLQRIIGTQDRTIKQLQHNNQLWKQAYERSKQTKTQ